MKPRDALIPWAEDGRFPTPKPTCVPLGPTLLPFPRRLSCPRSRRGSYLDPSISRTLFASAAMLNGFVSTDIPTSK